MHSYHPAKIPKIWIFLLWQKKNNFRNFPWMMRTQPSCCRIISTLIDSFTNFIFSNVSGVAPHQYPELVEYNPVIAYDVLICLMSTNQITDYFSGKSFYYFPMDFIWVLFLYCKDTNFDHMCECACTCACTNFFRNTRFGFDWC